MKSFDNNITLDAYWMPFTSNRMFKAALLMLVDYAPRFQLGHPLAFRFPERLAEVAPPGLDRIFFTGSGSESVNMALKIALAYQREVIVGFGRLGSAFAAQHFEVTPDIMTTAKELTNGAVPMGAVFASRDVYDGLMQGPKSATRSISSHKHHSTCSGKRHEPVLSTRRQLSYPN